MARRYAYCLPALVAAGIAWAQASPRPSAAVIIVPAPVQLPSVPESLPSIGNPTPDEPPEKKNDVPIKMLESLDGHTLKEVSLEQIRAAHSGSRTAYMPAENHRLILLDMPNIRDQGHMFARIVIFVERVGTPKTRLMSIPEVRKWLAHTANSLDSLTVGNNLRAADLARFFNTARNQGEPLTQDERQLYDWLLQWNVLREEDAGVTVISPERVLITIPQASTIAGCDHCSVTAAQRAVILEHEMSHGKFATDTVYENYSLWFWSNVLTYPMREHFVHFLRQRGYDPSNRDLLANEAQAFLMHTPDPTMFSAAALGITDSELEGLRKEFQAGSIPKPLTTADKSYQFD